VYLDKGKLLVDLEVENSPRLTLENFAEMFSDGLWHSLEVTVGKNRVTLSVDERMVRTSRLMDIVTGDVYFMGGIDPAFLTFNSIQLTNQRGLIGCLRQISVDGAFRNPKDFKKNEVRPAVYSLRENFLPMTPDEIINLVSGSTTVVKMQS